MYKIIIADDHQIVTEGIARIIKEMRENTNARYPRFIVWENVPGAFSSHGGDDFQRVLEEICGICDGSVSVPGSAKWEPAGCILGDGFSVAWRVLDASKGWGVAQRRRRIFAVLDLAGTCAGPVLFESEGLSGFAPPGKEAREGTASGVETGAGAAGFCKVGYAGITRPVVGIGEHGEVVGKRLFGIESAQQGGVGKVVVLPKALHHIIGSCVYAENAVGHLGKGIVLCQQPWRGNEYGNE